MILKFTSLRFDLVRYTAPKVVHASNSATNDASGSGRGKHDPRYTVGTISEINIIDFIVIHYMLGKPTFNINLITIILILII